MPRFAVLASTNGTDLQALITRESELNAELALVVTDRECGALEKAKAANIKAILLPKCSWRNERDHIINSILKEEAIDFVVLIGYMRLMSAGFVNTWRNKILNIHPSLLPAFAGGMDRNVHEEVLKRGCTLTGATLHFVDEGADTGPIILQRIVSVHDEDTVDSLKTKVQSTEQDVLIEGINLYADNQLEVVENRVIIKDTVIEDNENHTEPVNEVVNDSLNTPLFDNEPETCSVNEDLNNKDLVKSVPKHLIPISEMNQEELTLFLKENAMSLTTDEVKLILQKIGRNPTMTELYIFNIEWSEHCSYKSSKDVLKLLPTQAPHVMLGPSEDAGIVHIATINNEKVGLVMKHESHNHPSQIVPSEGAATGIGGVVRDIACMGAKVIGIADALRFGNPKRKKTKYITQAVIDGIAGYANPLGIPNVAGDIYLNDSFDENCLVNVVGLGIVNESEIIHSAVPEDAAGYDVILVGKATDHSGFGGAAFASVILDEEEQNKSAVQVPDPFLKNVLLRATYKVFEEIKKRNICVGFKDCGAGGLMCASSELGSTGGAGIEIDIDKVHVSMDLPPYVTACSETQERFVWVVPKEFTPTILDIYNNQFELGDIAQGAQAAVVGFVREDNQYVLKSKGEVVCDLPIDEVTEGIRYQRESKPIQKETTSIEVDEPVDYKQAILGMLSHPNVACKAQAYKHYDTEVQGNAIIRPGEADAGVIAPIPNEKVGIALSVDCNPRYTRIDPYWGAAHAVAESMRNVAAVGAKPWALTDCLNFGNPEKPESFWEFKEAVRGISDAARNIKIKEFLSPTPFISGNVSFYNESSSGKTVDPSPIIACAGVLDDYTKAITPTIKSTGSILLLIGKRGVELGGSVWFDMHNKLGNRLPSLDFGLQEKMIYSTLELIDKRLLLSCHDISDGGLITAISEMRIGSKSGCNLFITNNLRPDMFFFCEHPGFVIEIKPDDKEQVINILNVHNIEALTLGTTNNEKNMRIIYNGKKMETIEVSELARVWNKGFREAVK